MRFQTFKKPVDYAIAGFCILIMTSLVFCVVWQVFSRYVMNQPSTFTDEIARFAMIWVGLLGAAYTTGLQKHLAIDLFSSRFAGRSQYVSVLFINLCILAFAASAMIWGGWTLVAKVYSTGQVSPAMQMPMAYVYGVLPISGSIISYYSLLFILDAAIDLLTQPKPVEEGC
ncbi:TRAP transporter small permease [Gynuella sp.]|uniref:TRAP transporter small permease n=1 Tax=Gynuella sp. TaxID=2969146 RepID=UPI003D0FAB57